MFSFLLTLFENAFSSLCICIQRCYFASFFMIHLRSKVTRDSVVINLSQFP